MNRRTLIAIQWLLVASPMLVVFALFIVVEVLPAAGHTRTAPCFVNVHGERVCVMQRAVCSTDAECEGIQR